MALPRSAFAGARPLSAALLLSALLSPSAPSQTLLHRIDGSAPGDRAGCAVSGGQDADGDGVPDLAIALLYGDGTATDSGSVLLHSGATGAPLYRFDGGQSFQAFGAAVALVDDLDGDGHAELLIGAPLTDLGGTDCGQAYLFSGRDYSLRSTFSGS